MPLINTERGIEISPAASIVFVIVAVKSSVDVILYTKASCRISSVTVIVTEAVFPLPSRFVTLRVAVPGATPWIYPYWSTVIIDSSLDSQSTCGRLLVFSTEHWNPWLIHNLFW